MPTVINGKAGHLYYTTSARTTWSAATTGPGNIYVATAPPQTLTELTVARNVNNNAPYGKTDQSTRAGVPYKLTGTALIDLAVEIDIPWAPADTGFQALLDAFLAGNSIAFWIADGTTVTHQAQGYWADFIITDFPRDEPIEKEMLSKVKASPTSSAVAPQWAMVL